MLFFLKINWVLFIHTNLLFGLISGLFWPFIFLLVDHIYLYVFFNTIQIKINSKILRLVYFNLHSLLRNYLKLFREDSCVLMHFITFTKCFKIVDGKASLILKTQELPGGGGGQGRIQEFVLGETKVGEGSGDRLRSPTGPGQSPCREPRGAKPPRKLLGCL
jgi:hypothetical protein